MEGFFGHVSGLNHNLVPNVAKAAQGVRLYFLALTYPDVVPALVDIPKLTTGVGAIELHVDLLHETGSTNLILSHTHVLQWLSMLRRITSLPIVLTVRMIAQGGAFPNDVKKKAADLLKLALRVGCEYIDVKTTLPPHFIKEIVHLKGASEIIASFHDWTGAITWDAPTVTIASFPLSLCFLSSTYLFLDFPTPFLFTTGRGYSSPLFSYHLRLPSLPISSLALIT